MKAGRYPEYRTKDQRKLFRRVFGPKYRRIFGPKYPRTWTPLPLERRFSAEEYDLIVAGHVSESMDDHWNILFKDDTLYLYRSWTGVCMFRVRFVRTGDEYAVAGAALGISPFADHIDHRAMLNDVIRLRTAAEAEPL